MSRSSLVAMVFAVGIASVSQSANAASQIVVGGDVTGTFNLNAPEWGGIEGNRTFFDRVRFDASNVIVSGNSYNSYSQQNLVNFYGGISGVNVSVLSGQITTEALGSAGLLVLQFPKFQLGASEISSIGDFVRGGGNLLLLGEYRDANTVYPAGDVSQGTLSNGILNELLAGVGATMRLANDTIGCCGNLVTTEIVTTPLTSGITSFGYGAVSSVTGGQALFMVPADYNLPEPTAFFAVETLSAAGGVPESSTWGMLIAGFGLTGLAVRRRAGQTTGVRQPG